ncbi:MAG: type III pantothenate kinase [Arenicellales bacterium]|nr:type III pantothenate kinase [Arenicellales bacterium]
MKLVVDVGNSRIKWARIDNNRLANSQSVAMQGDTGFILDYHWGNMSPPEAVLVSNVAGKEAEQNLQTWIQKNWGIDPAFFRSTATYQGISNEYARPEQLGCDRWAGLIGARSLLEHGSLCVVDCGTAITVDALTADDRFIGGIIFPGIDLIQQSLLEGTSDIVENRAEFKQVLGTTTAEGVSGGSFIGVAGAIDRALHEMYAILDNPKLYITGGDAPLLLPMLTKSLQHEPDLVLLGLAHTLK